MNPLFIIDLIFLPVTFIRMLTIYLYGSRYNIGELRFLDVMMHADKPYFNQDTEYDPTIDTISDDVRKIIRFDSHVYEMTEINLKNKENETQNENKTKSDNSNEDSDSDNDIIRKIIEDDNIKLEDIDSDTDSKDDVVAIIKSAENIIRSETDKKSVIDLDINNKQRNLTFLLKNAEKRVGALVHKNDSEDK